jgi:hypothetical protein
MPQVTRLLRLLPLALLVLPVQARTAGPEPGPATKPAGPGAAAPRVEFDAKPGRIAVRLDRQIIATYVYGDADIHRPYFEHLRTPDGIQVTRNYPPVAGKDPADHPHMHPGLWLAFGDISGSDFWRNKGPKVEHERFAQEPQAGEGKGSFAVVNRYVSGEKVLCRETMRCIILPRPAGYLIVWDSSFTAGADGLVFGSQEEMGLGVRLATPLSVKSGKGRITNSRDGVNEKGTWGMQAEWCDYAGTLEGRQAGITLMTDPESDHKPWFHTRDYGLMVANPFGPRAERPEKLEVNPHKALRLRFGILVHSSDVQRRADPAAEYQQFARLGRDGV